MTVLEVGIFQNSVLILYKSFYPLSYVDDAMDYQKRSKLINQIQKMGEYILKKGVEYLDNQKYRIYFSVPKSYNTIFIYAIDDKNSSKRVVQDLLNTILMKFHHFYPKIEYNPSIQEVGQYQQFLDVIDQTLSDERFTPLDRIKKLLL